MKANHKTARKHRLFEFRQHVKTPPSLHALIELAPFYYVMPPAAALLAWPGNVN